jgi:hypothetical protein
MSKLTDYSKNKPRDLKRIKPASSKILKAIEQLKKGAA